MLISRSMGRRASLSAMFALASSPWASAGDVLIVDMGGGGSHTSIQSAIEAAADGDLILVAPGYYAGFVLSGKGVAIAASAAGVTIQGSVTIELLEVGQAASLSRIQLTSLSNYQPALQVRDSAGHVWLQDCTLRGVDEVWTDYPVAVVEVINGAYTVLSQCQLDAGDGVEATILGYPGADALRVENSDVALYDCILRAGDGGYGTSGISCGYGGYGGTAVQEYASGFVYVSGGSLHRGTGGTGSCGNGASGFALHLDHSEAHLLDVELHGNVGGGAANFLVGAARRLELPVLAIEGTHIDMELVGEPGDLVSVLTSPAPAFVPLLVPLRGILLIDAGFAAGRSLGAIPASGTLIVSLDVPKLALGVDGELRRVQARFLGLDGATFTSNARLVHLTDSIFPDCNANGVSDPIDLGQGTSPDCDANGVPDECDIASGTHPDCNANGIPDPCDLMDFVANSPVLAPIGFDDPQDWVVRAAPKAVGDVHLSFSASADLGEQHERIRVRVNGVELGSVFSLSGSDCPAAPDETELVTDAWTFNAAVASGDARIELLPSSTVDSLECASPSSFIAVQLRYATRTPASDCNGDGIPDGCQPNGDCNANGTEDLCDLGTGASVDCNANLIPDECDISSGHSSDCNLNGVPDACDLASGHSTDLDGNGVLDECQAVHVIHVQASQNGPADGTSWDTAFSRLEDALAVAAGSSVPAIQVWVAAGIYRPAPPGGARTLRFIVPARTSVYGGFAGAETSLDQRDVELNVTVLSGDLDGDDAPGFVNNAENSYKVVELTADPYIRLDGVSIRGGNANAISGSVNRRGGGLYVSGDGPLVHGCEIRENYATEHGGGAWLDGEVRLEACRLVGNRTGQWGGGAEVRNGSIVIDCLFSGNSSGLGGGGLYCGTAVVTGCRFLDNEASTRGGGVTLGAGDPTLVDCIFHGNLAEQGGAIHVPSVVGERRIHGCTVSENEASAQGGGVYFGTPYSTGIHNCVFWANRDSGTDPEQAQIANGNGAHIAISHCCIEGLDQYSGHGNIGADPLFVDPDGADDLPGTEDDDFHLSPGSACIDSGNKLLLPFDVLDLDGDGNPGERWSTDFDGAPRIVDDPLAPDAGFGPRPHVDRGAFEHPAPYHGRH